MQPVYQSCEKEVRGVNTYSSIRSEVILLSVEDTDDPEMQESPSPSVVELSDGADFGGNRSTTISAHLTD